MTNLTINNNRLFFGEKAMCFQEDSDSVLNKLGNICNEILEGAKRIVTKPVQFDCFCYNCLLDFNDGYLGNITLMPLSRGMKREEMEMLVRKAISSKYKKRDENRYYSSDIEIFLESDEDGFNLKIYGVL